MGESSKLRSILNQDGLRRRYMILLVPALAKVHANHPLESELLERAQAVRHAADACLVQALQATANNSACDHHHHRVSAQYRTFVPALSSRRPSLVKLKNSTAARHGSLSCRVQALIMRCRAKSKASGRSFRSKAPRSCSLQKRAARAAKSCRSYKRCRRDPGESEQGGGVEVSMPAESELRRLESVLFPSTKKSTDHKPAGDDLVCSVANPAAILSQAAQYIIALQVQVEALSSLANLSVD